MAEFSTNSFIEDFGGKGEVLLLLHGLGGSTNSWYPQAQVLKRDFRVFAYDLPGSGRTTVRDGVTMASLVNDLLVIVDKVTSGTKIHIAGHSMGSIIAQHFAAIHPDRSASLVLVGGFPAPPEAARDAIRGRAAKVRAEGMVAVADAIVAGGISDDTKANQPAAAAFVRESIMGQSAEGYARNCDALADAQAADLASIACPVLLLNGDQDKTAPPEVAQAMATQLRQGETQVIAGCGHGATVERPKQVSYAMTVFYARYRQTTSAE